MPSIDLSPLPGAVYERALLFSDDVTSLLKYLEEGVKDA